MTSGIGMKLDVAASVMKNQEPNIGYEDSRLGQEVLPTREMTDGGSDGTAHDSRHEENHRRKPANDKRDVEAPSAQDSPNICSREKQEIVGHECSRERSHGFLC